MPAPRSRTRNGALVSRFSFYCEDDDDVKRFAMHLVVNGDKYEKRKKVKHF
jgi:hypothetical protein